MDQKFTCIMKTILLLTNFSETSRKAIISYLKIHPKETKEKYKFLLLNVYSRLKTGQSQMVRFEDVLEQYSMQDLKKEYQKILETPGLNKLDIELVSRHGDLVDVIEVINHEQPVEMAVMGTKGSNIMKELLLGSDTDRFVRMSQNPLLVIPENVDFKKPEKVVYACFLTESDNTKEFAKLVSIVRLFEAELMVLHVYKEEQPPVAYFEERIQSEANGLNLSFHYVQNASVAAGISEFVIEQNAGLLALIDKKVGLLTKLFRQSVMDFVRMSQNPLLVIPESFDFIKPDRIVYACFLTESDNTAEFEKLVSIVKLFNAELMVLHVYKDEQPPIAYFEERSKSVANGIKISFHYAQNSSVAAGISEFVKEQNAGLLALIDKRVGLLTNLFRQSVMDKFASSASQPLLIIHK